MKNKRFIDIFLILLCALSISFCLPGAILQTSFAADDADTDGPTEVVDGEETEETDEDSEASNEAYAVFDSSDGSLTLFRGDAGIYTDGQTEGTRTYYAGIEEAQTSGRPKWWTHNAEIRSFSVAEGHVIKPVSCSYWFEQCQLLQEVDISGLDTSDTQNMSYMFSSCTSLSRLDLSGMDATNVTNMQRMFQNCSNLTLIKLGPDFRLGSACGIRMPLQRVRTDDDVTLVSEPICYSINDYTGDQPGWYRPGGKAMAVFDSQNGSLTFENDDNSEHLASVEEDGTKVFYTNILSTGTYTPPWYEHNRSVKTVAFKDHIAPLSCNRWFQNCYDLSICDLQKLDTSYTSNMNSIFSGCSAVYRIALGENSIFSSNLPNSGWKRYRLPDGTLTDGPELSNLKNYTGEDPGWYSREGAEISAVYDSEDGSLTFFNDMSGDHYNGQVVGTKTYYGNFASTNKVPWSDVKESISKVKFLDRIEPKAINNWFSGMTGITELDLTNLKIPSRQSNAFRGCTALKRLTVAHDENEIYVRGSSMLSGIWKNMITGTERQLEKDGYSTEDIIDEGVWELMTSAEVTLEVNADALGNTDEYDDEYLSLYQSEDGTSPSGEAIGSVRFKNGTYEFSVSNNTYVSSRGDIEYYKYILSSSNAGIEATWNVGQGTSASDIRIDVSLRDVSRTFINGTVNWEGDRPEDRPEYVMVELWQNGVRISEQEVTETDDWAYSFYVPAYDENGALYRYEVKEAPVENYLTRLEKSDGIRFITDRLNEMVSAVFFRRDGRWYVEGVNYSGGVMTIPGDAFYLPIGYSDLTIPGVSRISLNEKTADIADSWSNVQTGEEISLKDWLEGSDRIDGAEDGILIPLTGSDDEIMTLMSNYIDMDNYKDFYSVTGPYPFELKDCCGHILCYTSDMTSITNVSLRGKTEITGRKKWDSSPHPEEVTVILKQNGEELKRATVSEDDNWTYHFSDLPIFDSQGSEYEYTLTERPMKGYSMTRETGKAENYDKAVKVTYEINGRATSVGFNGQFQVAYDHNGTAYIYHPDQVADTGEYTVVFPTLDFDLAFIGAGTIHRGTRGSTNGFPVRVTSVELIDSPYENQIGSYFMDVTDNSVRWTAFDPMSLDKVYPDRSEMYHYGADEMGILAQIYAQKLSIIPYTIDMEKDWENLVNEYKEGKLTIVKTDEEGSALENAEFGLYFTENCPDDANWVMSEQEPTVRGVTNDRGELKFDNVPYGCYLLEEIKAPSGYKTDGTSHKVVIGNEEVIVDVSNDKTRTVIKKVNEKGEPLEGAELAVCDSTGREIDSWSTSGEATHEIVGLTEGETYVLKEVSPPEGYRTADDISFVINKGEDTEVTMTDRPEYVFMPIPTGVKTAGVLIPMLFIAAAIIMGRLKCHKR